MARDDKVAAVAELTDAFRDSSGAVLTEYRGLTVAQLRDLRRALAGNARYAVVKNTLTKIAAREAGIGGLDDLLDGPSAIAFVTGDPVAVAKGLRDFARVNPTLVVKGGFLDGRALSAEEMRRLADLESREVLLARVAGGLTASLSRAAALFAAPLSQAARLVAAFEDKARQDPSLLRPGAVAAPAAEAAEAVEAPAAEAPAAETPSPAPEQAEQADRPDTQPTDEAEPAAPAEPTDEAEPAAPAEPEQTEPEAAADTPATPEPDETTPTA